MPGLVVGVGDGIVRQRPGGWRRCRRRSPGGRSTGPRRRRCRRWSPRPAAGRPRRSRRAPGWRPVRCCPAPEALTSTTLVEEEPADVGDGDDRPGRCVGEGRPWAPRRRDCGSCSASWSGSARSRSATHRRPTELAEWANDQRDERGHYCIFGRAITPTEARVILRHPSRLVTVAAGRAGRWPVRPAASAARRVRRSETADPDARLPDAVRPRLDVRRRPAGGGHPAGALRAARRRRGGRAPVRRSRPGARRAPRARRRARRGPAPRARRGGAAAARGARRRGLRRRGRRELRRRLRRARLAAGHAAPLEVDAPSIFHTGQRLRINCEGGHDREPVARRSPADPERSPRRCWQRLRALWA